MRKLVLSFAALAAIGMVVPYAAPAKADSTIIIHKHRHRRIYNEVPPFHRHHDGKTVIIKHHSD